MARLGLAKTEIFLLREAMQGKRCVSNFVMVDQIEELRETINDEKKKNMSCWVPHLRTGIYYPKGYEWVMDDVPSGAATLKQTHWFRSSEGVADNSSLEAHLDGSAYNYDL